MVRKLCSVQNPNFVLAWSAARTLEVRWNVHSLQFDVEIIGPHLIKGILFCAAFVGNMQHLYVKL